MAKKKRDPAKVCGAKKANGELCQAWKGAGTTHTGIGRCKGHGGASPNHQVAAEKEMVEQRIRTYGSPIEVQPDIALLQEVHRTAGIVKWLQEVVSTLHHDGDGYLVEKDDEGNDVLIPRSGLKQMDLKGRFEKTSVWVEMFQKEREMLARVSKMALDANVSQRQIELAEAQSGVVIKLIKAILDGLDLNNDQRRRANSLVREKLGELRLLAS